MSIIYIDIGKKGGYAISDSDGELRSIGSIDTSIELNKLDNLLKTFDVSLVVFEKPFGISGNKNMNTFIHYGRIQAVPMRLGIEFDEVTPKEWISYYSGIGSDKKKHSKKAVSILKKMNFLTDLDLMKLDGIADAVLIYNYVRILNKHKG